VDKAKEEKEKEMTEYWNEINTYGDLPEYGKFVLVYGTDNKMYGIKKHHVCEMNDLEDGVDFISKGFFYWLTESGDKIEDVSHWMELPNQPSELRLRQLKIKGLISLKKNFTNF